MTTRHQSPRLAWTAIRAIGCRLVRSRGRWLALLLALLCGCSQPQASKSASAAKAGPGVFFVATNGNDAWSGLQPVPDGRGTDGPFATPARALRAVRRFRAGQGSRSHSAATVWVRDGAYFLAHPMVLGQEDSGLLLAAYPGEHPLLSGGRRISGWRELQRDGRTFWAADLPRVRAGHWYFRELWVNGRRAVRARYPNHGYLPIERVDKTDRWQQGQSGFGFRSGDFQGWSSLSNAEVVAMTRWVESRLPVVAIDQSQHSLLFSKRSVFELSPGDLYYAEGAFEFLDQPGEWYLDRAVGRLYYLPRAGERLDHLQAIAPQLVQVLRLEGRPEAPIEGLRLRGLSFAHTEWSLPEPGSPPRPKADLFRPKPDIGGFGQAAVGVPGAVWGQGLRDCALEGCAFVHLGNYGLELVGGCQSNRVVGCRFTDLGAGGIKLGEQSVRLLPAEQTRANLIEDCRIADGGHEFASAVGIWLGQTPDNRLLRNLIHDFYYTGISIGWTWGYGPSLASNNIIEFNHVHHIGVKAGGDGPILSDMGGIYTLGRQPGTVIRNNLWHDIAGVRYGGWGIYFDEGSSGVLAENNMVYRTTHGGFHQHYGETNLVRNNIFAFGRDQQLQRTRPESHLSFSFQTNSVYFDSGVLLAGNWTGGSLDMDWNLYFDARSSNTAGALPLGPMSLAAWRARGHDVHSLVADPLFVAPSQGDFRLQPGSPAFRLGFRSIDLSGVPGRD